MEIQTPFETEETSASQKQWFDGDNVVHTTVERISKIETAEEAAEMVDSLNDTTAYYQFVQGGVLAEIQKRSWTDHGEFYAHIEERHGIKKRKAQYHMSVYGAIVDLDIPWTDAKDVGWSNLRILAPHLTPENVADWISQAKGKTYKQMVEMIDAWKADGTIPTGPFDKEPSTPTSTFKVSVHEDQLPLINDAINKAKTEGQTSHDGTALEYMSMDFLAGGKKTTPSLSEMFQKVKDAADSNSDAADVIMGAFCNVFPDAHVEVEFDKTDSGIVAGEGVE
jgi:hypothetical protein